VQPSDKPSQPISSADKISERRSVSLPRSAPRAASNNVPRRQISSLQIVFGSIIAISLLLAVNFSGRIAAGQRLNGELRVLQATISDLQMRSTELKVQLANVNSDAFVEEWARSREGRMVKPDEYLVVVVPGLSTPIPMPPPVSAPFVDISGAEQNWSLWWSLFFDSPPPTGQ